MSRKQQQEEALRRLQWLQSSPAAFRSVLLIDTDAGPRPLAEILDPWQRQDFEALDSGWMRAAHGTAPAGRVYQRAYLERARGHSKTSDLAVMVAWMLFSSPRTISGVAAAGDQDQARLLRDAINRLVSLNEWLEHFLEVQKDVIRNPETQSELKIISADAASSYGIIPSFILVDELTHWKSRDLWDSLISSAAKRADCMLLVISNAGRGQGVSWQWDVREACRADPDWYFSRLDGPQASWITQKRLDEQRRMLPAKAFARLWLNQWVSDAGDALESHLIDRAVKPELRPMRGDEPGWAFVGGLDLSRTRDHSAFIIIAKDCGSYQRVEKEPRPLPPALAMLQRQGLYEEFPEAEPEYEEIFTPPTSKIRLAHVEWWEPEGGEIDYELIYQAVLAAHQRFRMAVYYDAYEAGRLVQQLFRAGVPVEEITTVGKNQQAMATELISSFNEDAIELFPCAKLIADLRMLSIVAKSYGFRIEAGRNKEQGHADRANALTLAMLGAKKVHYAGSAVVPGRLIVG